MANTVISIAGCGWYGLSLAKVLIKSGIAVKGSTTSPQKLPTLAADGIKPFLIDFSSNKDASDPDFFACDVLWICIPPKARTGDGEAYLHSIKNIIAASKKYAIKQVVLISSTSIYADDNCDVNELITANPDTTSGKVMLAAENLLKQQTAFTTTIIRFAGLFGPGREPGRFFAGKKDIANGNSPVNLIHLHDCIGVSLAILNNKAFGQTYNACTPDHPTKAEFYTKAATRIGLEKPDFLDEKKDWKIISSLFVDSVLNYQYQIDSLINWLDTPTDQ